MDVNSKIINSIRRRLKFRKFFIVLCVVTLILAVLSFLFYGAETGNQAIKFISKKDQLDSAQKVMMSPEIQFEHQDGQIFDISAKKAVHKNKNDVELSDVKASGNQGSIKAGTLLVTNGGNDLHFSDNPVLIIKETKNEQ